MSVFSGFVRWLIDDWIMGVDALRRDPGDDGGGVLSPLLYLDNLIVDTLRWDPCDVDRGVLSPLPHLDNMFVDAFRWDLCGVGGGVLSPLPHLNNMFVDAFSLGSPRFPALCPSDSVSNSRVVSGVSRL